MTIKQAREDLDHALSLMNRGEWAKARKWVIQVKGHLETMEENE